MACVCIWTSEDPPFLWSGLASGFPHYAGQEPGGLQVQDGCAGFSHCLSIKKSKHFCVEKNTV